MGQFRKQAKTLIVNSPDQLEVVTPAGGAITDDSDEIVCLRGFVDILYTPEYSGAPPQGKPKMTGPAVKTDPVDPAKEVLTFQVTSTGSGEDATFAITTTSIDGSEAQYHRDPIPKYYQIPASSTAAGIAADIAAAITADDNALVTASAASDTVTITAKDLNISIDIFSNTIEGTKTWTTKGTNGKGTYAVLKNIQWSNPIHGCSEFDRRAEYMPRKGAKYTEFRFEANTDVSYLGTQDVADAGKGRLSTSEYILYVDSSLTDLITSLEHAICREEAAPVGGDD